MCVWGCYLRFHRCMYVCVCLSVCLNRYVCVFVCLSMHVCECVCRCVCVCVCVCENDVIKGSSNTSKRRYVCRVECVIVSHLHSTNVPWKPQSRPSTSTRYFDWWFEWCLATSGSQTHCSRCLCAGYCCRQEVLHFFLRLFTTWPHVSTLDSRHGGEFAQSARNVTLTRSGHWTHCRSLVLDFFTVSLSYSQSVGSLIETERQHQYQYRR